MGARLPWTVVAPYLADRRGHTATRPPRGNPATLLSPPAPRGGGGAPGGGGAGRARAPAAPAFNTSLRRGLAAASFLSWFIGSSSFMGIAVYAGLTFS